MASLEKIESTGAVQLDDSQKEDCIFCSIAAGSNTEADLIYKDNHYVAFRNITPAAAHHYLIIPKEHIQDGNSLTGHHIPMLQAMEEIAKIVLDQQGGKLKSSRLGYHWPPFTSMPHLHLHVICPVSQMSFKSRVIFQPGTRWFLTPQEVIEKLNRRPLISTL